MGTTGGIVAEDLTLTILDVNGKEVGTASDGVWERATRTGMSRQAQLSRRRPYIAEEVNVIDGVVSREFGEWLANYPIQTYIVRFEHGGSVYEGKLNLEEAEPHESNPQEMYVVLSTNKPIRAVGTAAE